MVAAWLAFPTHCSGLKYPVFPTTPASCMHVKGDTDSDGPMIQQRLCPPAEETGLTCTGTPEVPLLKLGEQNVQVQNVG